MLECAYYKLWPIYFVSCVLEFTDFILEFKSGYTKMIQLTNVSYQISSIRFVSLSIALQDFCTVDFIPSYEWKNSAETTVSVNFYTNDFAEVEITTISE